MTISPLPDPQTNTIEPVELRIGRTHGNHPVSLVENTDLGVILGRGQEGTKACDQIPHSVEDGGVVVLSLDVNDDHDEVYYCRGNVEPLELIALALEALTACHDALQRVSKA